MLTLTPGIKSILENSLYSYLATMLNVVLRLVYVYFLARILGPDLYGLLAYGQSWYLSLLPISNLGLGALLAVDIAKNRTQGKVTAELVLAARIITVCFLACVSFLLAFFYEPNQQILTVLCLFSVALIGKGATMWAENMFRAHEKSRYILAIEKYFRPAELIVSLLIAFYTRNITFVAINHTVFICLQGACSFYLVQNRLGKTKANWDLSNIIIMIWQVLPLGIATPLNLFLITGPVMLLKNFGYPLSIVGNLSLSLQGFMVFNSLFSAIGFAALPVLSRAVERDDQRRPQFIIYSIKISVIIGFYTAILAMIVVDDLILFLFPSGFEDATQYTGLLLFALIPAICKNLLRSSLISSKMHKTILIADLSGVITLIVALYYLAANYHFIGAISAIICAYSVPAIIYLFALLIKKDIQFIEHILNPFLALAVGLVCFYLLNVYLPVYQASLSVCLLFLFNLRAFCVINQSETDLLLKLIKRA